MNKKYQTTDIWIASALIALEFKCNAQNAGYLKNGNIKYLYIFNETDDLKDKIYKLGNRELSIDVQTLKENYQMLKNLTYKQNENL